VTIGNWQQAFSNSKKLKRTLYALCAILFALCSSAGAQQPKKVPRIGYLTSTGRDSANVEAFRQGLKELGYIEGQTIAIEWRLAEGNNDRLPGLAAELVRLKVDVIFAAGGTHGVVAKKATSVIPIIFVGATDPVAAGLVESLARPGGNITGLSIGAPGLYGKRLELLKETIPGLSRVGLLLNPANPSADGNLRETRAAGEGLGVQVQSLEVRSPDEIDSAFKAANKAQAGAVIVAQHPPINSNPKRVIELAAKRRLPAIYPDPEWIRASGLMFYGPSTPDLYRRGAGYVDKILKGTKPGDLPVQQPIKFELVINLKAAKQIGLTIPPNVLARADRVIR
jgi:putative ABC transport system substrate-binding protein